MFQKFKKAIGISFQTLNPSKTETTLWGLTALTSQTVFECILACKVKTKTHQRIKPHNVH